jgi:hypothetical protein
MKSRAALLLSAGLSPSLALCQPVRCDRFEPKATLGGDGLRLSLDTDLPNSTVIMVTVSRSYWEGTPEREYPLDYFAARSAVKEWRTARAIRVDRAVWQKVLDERNRIAAVLGKPLRIARIDSHLTVALVVPLTQTDPRFGAGNRNLLGTKVLSDGLRVVTDAVRVEHPLGPTRRD